MDHNYVVTVNRIAGVAVRVACRHAGAEVAFIAGNTGPKVVARVCYFDQESMRLPAEVWVGMRKQAAAILGKGKAKARVVQLEFVLGHSANEL